MYSFVYANKCIRPDFVIANKQLSVWFVLSDEFGIFLGLLNKSSKGLRRAISNRNEFMYTIGKEVLISMFSFMELIPLFFSSIVCQ